MSRNEFDEQFVENLIRRTIHMVSEVESSNLVKAAKQIADTQEFVEKIAQSNHSITQELVNQGAFDVAKNYIDFLKAQYTERQYPLHVRPAPRDTKGSKPPAKPVSLIKTPGAVTGQKTPTPPSDAKKPIVGDEKHA